MPVDHSESIEPFKIDHEEEKEIITNAFDAADAEGIDQSDFDPQLFGKEEPNTQWHDVQIVETGDGAQELVIENLENLQNTSALIVTRHGKNFKIGI